MGRGYRVFLVDQDDQLHKISQKRFYDLFDRERGTTVLRPFIGEDKVRYVHVFYETARRKPSTILRIDYHILPLTADGTVDHVRKDEGLRLLLHARSVFEVDKSLVRREGSVVDGTRIFAEKRVRHEWEWQPSFELQQRIQEAVFR